ncbi:MAG: hypothetical protein HYV15_01190 [Elusimicrobia bacterium]|nr:hypothetical protein [Elusimicrobiota bacterium]
MAQPPQAAAEAAFSNPQTGQADFSPVSAAGASAGAPCSCSRGPAAHGAGPAAPMKMPQSEHSTVVLGTSFTAPPQAGQGSSSTAPSTSGETPVRHWSQ